MESPYSRSTDPSACTSLQRSRSGGASKNGIPVHDHPALRSLHLISGMGLLTVGNHYWSWIAQVLGHLAENSYHSLIAQLVGLVRNANASAPQSSSPQATYWSKTADGY